jgi:hypothetical protein
MWAIEKNTCAPKSVKAAKETETSVSQSAESGPEPDGYCLSDGEQDNHSVSYKNEPYGDITEKSSTGTSNRASYYDRGGYGQHFMEVKGADDDDDDEYGYPGMVLNNDQTDEDYDKKRKKDEARRGKNGLKLRDPRKAKWTARNEYDEEDDDDGTDGKQAPLLLFGNQSGSFTLGTGDFRSKTVSSRSTF